MADGIVSEPQTDTLGGLLLNPEGIYDLKNLCARLGIQPYYFTMASQEGRLKVTQFGLKTFIKGSEVIKFMEGGKMKKRVVVRKKNGETAEVANPAAEAPSNGTGGKRGKNAPDGEVVAGAEAVTA